MLRALSIDEQHPEPADLAVEVDCAAVCALAGIDPVRYMEADQEEQRFLLRVAERTHELYEARLTQALAKAFGGAK